MPNDVLVFSLSLSSADPIHQSLIGYVDHYLTKSGSIEHLSECLRYLLQTIIEVLFDLDAAR